MAHEHDHKDPNHECGCGPYEQCEDHALDLKCRVVTGESHEIDVGAVQHQLDTDEDADGVALGGHADGAADE